MHGLVWQLSVTSAVLPVTHTRLPVSALCCVQMRRGLDIDICDEASSTVIHVKAPISARLCDVSCVFDKLGE